MAAPKVIPAKCPTCGANLPVPPGMVQITCRYCNNVISVEHRKAPPHVQPFGAPGVMPSRTLYVDPAAAARAGKSVGCMIALGVLLPILLPIMIGVGPWAIRSCKGAVKPFPASCGVNEEIELSGNFESAGPILTEVGTNCKIHIKDSKLKGSTLIKGSGSNLTLTLDNVTIETTDAMVRAGVNFKMKIHKSTLTSGGNVFDSDSNMEFQELDGSTIESKAGVAIKSKYNLKLHAENTKIRGKKGAVDTDSSFELTMKKASEITSSDGVALKTSSGFKLEAEGGKIDGAAGAIASSSGVNITATGLTISSKETTIKVTSGFKADLTDSAITSLTEAAIDGDSGMELVLANTKINGVGTAINAESSLKVRAAKKTRIAASAGNGITTTSNMDLNLNDASVEGTNKGVKGTVNTKIRLSQGARIAGTRGGVEVDSNFDMEATGAAIDGGAGAGLFLSSNAKIAFRQGALRGVPAIEAKYRPQILDLEGTKVDGAQRIAGR